MTITITITITIAMTYDNHNHNHNDNDNDTNPWSVEIRQNKENVQGSGMHDERLRGVPGESIAEVMIIERSLCGPPLVCLRALWRGKMSCFSQYLFVYYLRRKEKDTDN